MNHVILKCPANRRMYSFSKQRKFKKTGSKLIIDWLDLYKRQWRTQKFPEQSQKKS